MDNKQYLKEQIANMSERELMEYSAFTQAQNEKYLDSIRKSLRWVLGIAIFVIAFYVLSFLMVIAGTTFNL